MSWHTLHPDVKATAHQVLTPLQLRVLKDRLNGHSWRTIADALGKDEATVRGHHARAVRRMKPHMRKDAAA